MWGCLGSPGIAMRIIFLIISLFFTSRASAAGFIGPGALKTVLTASGVLQAASDAPCVLEGHIVSRVQGRKNRYVFRDGSGEIIVEIKRKVFGAHTVTPENLVRLEGEVEVDDKYPNEMEADTLTILE